MNNNRNGRGTCSRTTARCSKSSCQCLKRVPRRGSRSSNILWNDEFDAVQQSAMDYHQDQGQSGHRFVGNTSHGEHLKNATRQHRLYRMDLSCFDQRRNPLTASKTPFTQTPFPFATQLAHSPEKPRPADANQCRVRYGLNQNQFFLVGTMCITQQLSTCQWADAYMTMFFECPPQITYLHMRTFLDPIHCTLSRQQWYDYE